MLSPTYKLFFLLKCFSPRGQRTWNAQFQGLFLVRLPDLANSFCTSDHLLFLHSVSPVFSYEALFRFYFLLFPAALIPEIPFSLFFPWMLIFLFNLHIHPSSLLINTHSFPQGLLNISIWVSHQHSCKAPFTGLFG